MSNKILHIDTDLQIPNRIFKDDNNQVSQITDKAQNIAFTQSDVTKMPIYNYDGYYEFADGNKISGVNKAGFKIGTNPIMFFIDIEFAEFTNQYTYPFGLMRAVDEMAFGFRNQLNKIQFLATSTGGDWYAYAVNYTLLTNTRYKIITIINDGLIHFIINNIYVARQFFTKDIYGADFLEWSLGGTFGSASNAFKLFQVKVFDYVDSRFKIDTPTATEYSMEYLTNDFNYIQRYKEGEFYLSSKYLKDAVIDSTTNKILALYSAIDSPTWYGGARVIQITEAAQPKISDKGIYIELNTLIGTFQAVNLLPKGSSDFTFSFWAKGELLNSVSVIINSSCLLVYLLGETSLVVRLLDENNNQTNITTVITVDISNYCNYHVTRFGDTIYIYVNGRLINMYSLTVGYLVYEGTESLSIGFAPSYQSFVGYFDDLYINHTAIVDPTGYAIGDKVFEPPRRGGFNSNINQYPIP